MSKIIKNWKKKKIIKFYYFNNKKNNLYFNYLYKKKITFDDFLYNLSYTWYIIIKIYY